MLATASAAAAAFHTRSNQATHTNILRSRRQACLSSFTQARQLLMAVPARQLLMAAPTHATKAKQNPSGRRWCTDRRWSAVQGRYGCRRAQELGQAFDRDSRAAQAAWTWDAAPRTQTAALLGARGGASASSWIVQPLGQHMRSAAACLSPHDATCGVQRVASTIGQLCECAGRRGQTRGSGGYWMPPGSASAVQAATGAAREQRAAAASCCACWHLCGWASSSRSSSTHRAATFGALMPDQ